MFGLGRPSCPLRRGQGRHAGGVKVEPALPYRRGYKTRPDDLDAVGPVLTMESVGRRKIILTKRFWS
jgi:hypothetical protein